jgi:CRP/FNR family cyclic AMP-dependent transcriptional regulator
VSVPGDAKRSLRRVRIFASLDTETLDRLEKRCRWRNYRPGQEVIQYRGTAAEVYFLISGSARVIIHSASGKDVPFRIIDAGDIFGEFAAIDDKPRSASIEVLKPSRVASMSSWDFKRVVREEPDVAMALLRHLTAEARRLTSRVFEFRTLAVRNRIHAELLRLAGDLAPERVDAVIRPAPTHSEIANRISSHREAVSREFSRLARLGIVQRQGPMLVIKDVPRLAEMVRDAMGE